MSGLGARLPRTQVVLDIKRLTGCLVLQIFAFVGQRRDLTLPERALWVLLSTLLDINFANQDVLLKRENKVSADPGQGFPRMIMGGIMK